MRNKGRKRQGTATLFAIAIVGNRAAHTQAKVVG
jgi:hypothetical protein